MFLAGVQPLAQDVDVDPGFRIVCPGRGLAIDVKPSLAEGAVEVGEGAAELSPRAGLVKVRPEQRSQSVAGVGLVGESEVGEQGDGLVATEVDGLAVQLDLRWSKQV